MQLQSYKSIRAYTLIELMVAISVVSIIFVIGYASFREFSRRQSINGTVKKIVSDLRFAQQLASSGQKLSGLTCTTLEGYGFTSLGDSYQIFADCSNGDIITKTVELEDGIEIENVSVLFKVLGQGTNLDDDLIINVVNLSTETSGTITIGKGGEIQ